MIARPTIGLPAPDIDLPSSRGGRWKLADHRGRAVVVVFHRHNH
ncbi:hypothetical protein YM304_17210 [Ilumatobacter coccineus YM16-304]|uniref:Alkyl hydroperoxide reductase subunit C/ Thiol specific antioxidant domain-containing protein n=1 Tax=Ilumatobacter coccineus (strain NBRC 103263 / KCTC 29153 / YM16-304) TaxID=1313172 RepID=A0A6C7EA74_ILUCY|nr:hypothetical protein YM304_17210 [Ilumatobacter coccineus YM16-304]